MSEPFLAQIVMFAGNFAPRSWAFCDGQLLPISQNTALFSLLGTIYGGDGRTTFGLPELRGRFATHAGTGPGLSPRTQGQKGGAEQVTLNVNQMPPHNHQLRCHSVAANSDTPANNYPAVDEDATESYHTAQNAPMNPEMMSNAGGGQPVPITNPYIVVNFIIALQGVYPSRN